MKNHAHILVLNTCPDQATAEKIATSLVERQLAACVNIVPGLTSIYRWQGKIEQGQEALLLIKSRLDKYAELEAQLRQQHPYELPEILKVSLSGGLPDYLAWIDNSLDTTP